MLIETHNSDVNKLVTEVDIVAVYYGMSVDCS